MKKFIFIISSIFATMFANAQINIDGNNSDWSSVQAIATESSGMTTLKVFEDANNLYFYVEGTIGTNTDFYIDADNDATTGYTANQGYDFLFENGSLLQYSGDGSSWNWTDVTTADVQWQATTSFIENKAPKSILNIFKGELRAFSATMDNNWAELSKIPASGTPSLYTTPVALSVSPATLSNYTYIEGSGPSSSQSFTLSGTNLTGTKIVVSAPANYEISSNNSTFTTSLNINYSGSTLADTTIYVRLKVNLSAGTYNNEIVTCNDNGTAPNVSVTNNGTVTSSSPTLSVSPSSLSGYSYTEGSVPSNSQSFALSGTNLDGSTVSITAPTNYEVSSDNSSFSTSVNVNYSGSTLANTTIYVRLKAGLSTGTYNNELVICNDNGTASDVSVTNNGTVTSGSSYYVSTTGNDANDGTLASPFKTIQKALDVVSPACTIYVRSGTYKEHLYWKNSGTVGNIITIQNYNGEKVYLNGASGGTNDNENIMFTISNMSYITIDGFIIHNNIRAYAEGIYFNGKGTDITIKNCELYDISWTNDTSAMPTSDDNAHAMVFVGSQATSINNVTIENCHIHNCITGYSEGLTMVGNVEYFTIINNTVNDITNIGIDLAGYWSWTGAPASVNYARNGLVKGNTVYNCTSPVATSGGIYCDGAQYITIENNIVYGNPVGIDIGMENNDTITGSVARNNLIYNNKESGIFFGAYASGGLLTNSIIEGNTLYNNDMGHAMGDWTGEIYLNKTKDCKIINNIIYPRDATNKKAIIMPPKTTSNLTIDYNLYWRTTAGVSAMQDISTDQNTYTVDTHKVEADPQFITPESDFHIKNTSPALNAGDPSYVSFASNHPLATDVDIDGQTRVYGDSIDIGCDEVITAPMSILSASPSTLSGYTYTEGSGSSSSQSFTLSGTNLDGSAVSITAPANYEVSSDNSSFSTSVNINYSGSTLANTTIYVRLKAGLSAGTYNNELITCNDNGTASDVSVTNNGTVTSSSPTLLVSPETLSDYTYTEGSGPSNSQSFTLSGTNLNGSTVNITAPTNYEVSSDNSSFSTSLNVNYSGSTLANTTIYVRLKAGLSAGTYNNELVTCNDNGTASDVSVTNNGTVTPLTPALLASPETLSGYTYTEGSGPSSSQNFTLSGTNLNGSAVNITAPTNYEVSSDNSTFSTSVNVNYSGSTLADTTIYVRLKACLSSGTYNNELVTCNDNGTASDVSITNNGTVTSSSPTSLVSHETSSEYRIFSVKNRVYIKNNTDSPAFIKIYDLSGKLIHKQNLNSVNTELTLNVRQGIYLVKVYNNISIDVKKILILK